MANDELITCAKVLDKHYIPTRYPNGLDSGAPADFYTRQEAETACDQKTRRDRMPDYLPLAFPVGIDLFVYTEEELAQLRVDHASFARAIDSGIDV